MPFRLLAAALILLVGCSSSSSETAPTTSSEEPSTTAEVTTTIESPTTTEATTTTEPSLANREFPIGDEDFDEIYRLLDAIRSEAFITNDLELFESAVTIGQDSRSLSDQIEAGERRAEALSYTIDSVQVWFEPAEDSVVLLVTDTRTGPFDWVDDTGEVVRSNPARRDPTGQFAVTMRRNRSGTWKVIDDIFLSPGIAITSDEIAVGAIETLALGNSAVSTWTLFGGFCFVHHDPMAVFCLDDETLAGFQNPTGFPVRWRFIESDRSNVLFVLTAQEDPANLELVEISSNGARLDSVITADGLLIAVDPRSQPTHEIELVGPSRVINTIGLAGDG